MEVSRVEPDEPVGPLDQNRLEDRMKAHHLAICLRKDTIFAGGSTISPRVPEGHGHPRRRGPDEVDTESLEHHREPHGFHPSNPQVFYPRQPVESRHRRLDRGKWPKIQENHLVIKEQLFARATSLFAQPGLFCCLKFANHLFDSGFAGLGGISPCNPDLIFACVQ